MKCAELIFFLFCVLHVRWKKISANFFSFALFFPCSHYAVANCHEDITIFLRNRFQWILSRFFFLSSPTSWSKGECSFNYVSSTEFLFVEDDAFFDWLKCILFQGVGILATPNNSQGIIQRKRSRTTANELVSSNSEGHWMFTECFPHLWYFFSSFWDGWDDQIFSDPSQIILQYSTFLFAN